jgi:hypothetical protein
MPALAEGWKRLLARSTPQPLHFGSPTVEKVFAAQGLNDGPGSELSRVPRNSARAARSSAVS